MNSPAKLLLVFTGLLYCLSYLDAAEIRVPAEQNPQAAAEHPLADRRGFQPESRLLRRPLRPHVRTWMRSLNRESDTRGPFATAPVCSPARSCLITGMYATSLGTQRLRSQFPVPKQVRGFSAWLRNAGYYCSNNVKTDYNLRDEPAFIADAWDESSATAHWRKRRPGQPFFAVFNFMTTHQSRTSVWPYEQFENEIGAKLSPDERHDPAAANLPPYYPDTNGGPPRLGPLP